MLHPSTTLTRPHTHVFHHQTDALRQQMHTRYAHLYDEYGQRKQGGGGDRTSQWA